jgi:hypothetical protein
VEREVNVASGSEFVVGMSLGGSFHGREVSYSSNDNPLLNKDRDLSLGGSLTFLTAQYPLRGHMMGRPLKRRELGWKMLSVLNIFL